MAKCVIALITASQVLDQLSSNIVDFDSGNGAGAFNYKMAVERIGVNVNFGFLNFRGIATRRCRSAANSPNRMGGRFDIIGSDAEIVVEVPGFRCLIG